MVKICHESDVAFDGQQVALQPLLYFFFFFANITLQALQKNASWNEKLDRFFI